MYHLKFAGGLAFIDDSFYLSRPIHDSFALVKTGDIEGVRVKYSNTYAGTTDKNGELLVPDLISYQSNPLSVESSDIPIGYTLKEDSKRISPLYRSGGKAEFNIAKLKTFEGRLYFLENGEKIPAEYAGLEIGLDDQTSESVIGIGGFFYLENLPPGTFPARLFSGEKEYHFHMVIPDSDETITDLGEISCEPEN